MKINNETKIGIFITLILAILAVLTWRTGNFDFTPEGYDLNLSLIHI